MERPRHRVSTKIALLNPAKSKVLLTRLHDGRYGLPGGHVEGNETPEEAIGRELREELGVIYQGSLHKSDFWRDPNGDRILLGFIGSIDEALPLTLQEEEVTGVYWASIDDFDSGKVTTETYEPFIRKVLTASF